MADERRSPPYNQPRAVPAKYNPADVPQKRDCGMSFREGRLWLQMDVLHWPTLLKKDGDDLFDHYRHMLESLGNITVCEIFAYSPGELADHVCCSRACTAQLTRFGRKTSTLTSFLNSSRISR